MSNKKPLGVIKANFKCCFYHTSFTKKIHSKSPFMYIEGYNKALDEEGN
jgi:hypothetical protein